MQVILIQVIQIALKYVFKLSNYGFLHLVYFNLTILLKCCQTDSPIKEIRC